MSVWIDVLSHIFDQYNLPCHTVFVSIQLSSRYHISPVFEADAAADPVADTVDVTIVDSCASAHTGRSDSVLFGLVYSIVLVVAGGRSAHTGASVVALEDAVALNETLVESGNVGGRTLMKSAAAGRAVEVYGLAEALSGGKTSGWSSRPIGSILISPLDSVSFVSELACELSDGSLEAGRLKWSLYVSSPSDGSDPLSHVDTLVLTLEISAGTYSGEW